MDQPRPGAEFAGYRIEAEAGRGGMGIVYRATHLKLERPVALKLIAPELAQDGSFRARFSAESRVAASIDHPNVIPIYEADEADGLLFLAMRYVEGTDLRTLILAQGRLAPGRATRIVDQLGGALDAAHERGLVHRDVKPGNVLVTGPESREHVYLTDFGVTKQTAAGPSLTATGQWVGTIDYAAPEQIEGRNLDARTDVYALGCVLYQSLTGRIPFERESDVAKIYAHLNDPPPAVSEAVPGAPLELDAVVQRAMAKRPDDRYPSAGDVGRAAAAAAGPRAPERSVASAAAPTAPSEDVAETVPARPPGPAPPAPRGARRQAAPTAPPTKDRPWSPLHWALLGLVAATLLVGGVVAVVLTDALSSGEDNAAGEQEAAAKARFAAKANEICADFAPRAEAANRQIDASSPSTVRAGYDVARSVLSELRGKLNALTPPARLRADYEAYLGLFDDQLSLLDRIESARLAGDSRRLRSLEPEASSLHARMRQYARRLALDRACPRGP